MRLFGGRPTTVDEAVAPLLRAQDDLREVAEVRRQRAAQKNEQARNLLDAAEADSVEADRANAVLSRLDALTQGL